VLLRVKSVSVSIALVEATVKRLLPAKMLPLFAAMANCPQGDVVPIPSVPAKYALPVVVAPPAMVSPPVCAPLPMVDDAWDKKPFGRVRNPVESKVLVAVPPKYALVNTDNKLVDALANCCNPVQLFALARLMPTVRAVEPLYEPEKVRVESVAVRSARFWPSAMPEMVECVRPALSKVPVMESGAKLKVPLELVMLFWSVRPLKVVAEVVAKVMAPVWAEP